MCSLNKQMVTLPNEIWTSIWKYDSTYHDYFRIHVLSEIRLLRCKELASDYYDKPSQHFESYFRFFQNNKWFRAHFEEINYRSYNITLYNENDGTFCNHLHHVY